MAKPHVMHRRCYNGCTMCQPDAEGKAAERLIGKEGEERRVTQDWALVTCRACLKRRPDENRD